MLQAERSSWSLFVAALATVLHLGCGTTRQTDTVRSATEMLLVSRAIDRSVSQMNFSPLRNKTVFFDTQNLDTVVDKGYLIGTLRQALLAHGALLQEERPKADYVVEARTGGLGTDRYSLLIGVPQMTVPSLVPGQPSAIPEIPFAKKTEQEGVAKIAVVAYNRRTGHALWQSGICEGSVSARDTWICGTGPFRRGMIVHGTELAGIHLSVPGEDKGDHAQTEEDRMNSEMAFKELPAPAGSSPGPSPTTPSEVKRAVFTVPAAVAK
jgi:hypothetical protein